jgi:hypothetical protein
LNTKGLQFSSPEFSKIDTLKPAYSKIFLTCTLCMISGFCCEVDEIYTLLGYYTVYSGISLLMFWDNLPGLLTLEDGTDRLSQNIGKALSLS